MAKKIPSKLWNVLVELKFDTKVQRNFCVYCPSDLRDLMIYNLASNTDHFLTSWPRAQSHLASLKIALLNHLSIPPVNLSLKFVVDLVDSWISIKRTYRYEDTWRHGRLVVVCQKKIHVNRTREINFVLIFSVKNNFQPPFDCDLRPSSHGTYT